MLKINMGMTENVKKVYITPCVEKYDISVESYLFTISEGTTDKQTGDFGNDTEGSDFVPNNGNIEAGNYDNKETYDGWNE